jgi:iron complex outermembrane recepter protein
MMKTPVYLSACSALSACLFFVQTPCFANTDEATTVTIRSARPTSIPTNIPTTTESITAERIAQTVNATDSADALKYFPSLVVRKRYAGDFDHAVLATRASGTGNSARSLVYADGILLSNLLGNGASFTPRWGLVTPEEIERVDVLYGPFSAAYSGNSVGAVVDYLTRMPSKFEAHAKIGFSTQSFGLYSSKSTYNGNQASASLGSAAGDWAWWVSVARQASEGQPLVLANRLVSSGAVGASGTPVTGAVLDADPRNRPWLLLGTSSQIDTVQEHAKVKLAYGFSPTVKLSYTFGWWHNTANRFSESYLRDAVGNPVYSGNVNIGGRTFALLPADFPLQRQVLEHQMQGLNLKSNSKAWFDYELSASQYRYGRDLASTSQSALPSALTGGAGRLTSLNGTGWNNLSLRGTWRPEGSIRSAHVVDFGFQQDRYQLRSSTIDTANWLSSATGAPLSGSTGDTKMDSVYIQDTWRIAPNMRTSFGLRHESWVASKGSISNPSSTIALTSRKESYFSPKAAFAYDVNSDLTLKSSYGRSIRFPTVSELYQGSISANVLLNNDPNLRPERANTGELSAEYSIPKGLLRATIFQETTRDALYSQTNVTVLPNVTNVQNVDLIKTTGVEFAAYQDDSFVNGLNLAGSITYADSTILANAKFPASVGGQQPRVPYWRAHVVATYQTSDRLSTTLGARYSGKQFGTLDNIDTNANAYTGFSKYFVVDARMRYRFTTNWLGSIGIDNLTNRKYWAFHPYPQRTLFMDLKYQVR